MTDGALAAAAAAVFVWLGMVLAISFLEAPLKFRAPGVTIQLGLGIGRLVFRALNGCEITLAATALVALTFGHPTVGALAAVVIAIIALSIQLVAVRPALTRRSNAVLTDADGVPASRSRSHYIYVGLEGIKVVALLVSGILLLT